MTAVSDVLTMFFKLYPIEVKATSTLLPQHASALNKWRDVAGALEPSIIAADIASPISLAPGIRAVPWWWM